MCLRLYSCKLCLLKKSKIEPDRKNDAESTATIIKIRGSVQKSFITLCPDFHPAASALFEHPPILYARRQRFGFNRGPIDPL